MPFAGSNAAMRSPGIEVCRTRGGLAPVTAMMARFRSVATTADLLACAPREIVEIGYDRCLVSRVHRGRWIARSSWVRDDADLAHAITAAGSEVPAVLDRRLIESDLISTRSPVLVRDAQRHPRVHRRLIDVTASTAYVAAPIQVGDAVVGFVHVDRTRRSEEVDESDVEVVGLITECLGYALERTIGLERLQAMRASLASWSSSTLGLLDDVVPDLDPGAVPATAPAIARPTAVHSGPDKLTARELEVLERIAAGEGNADIATALYISHATVKAHVKHIFRKLGVGNRAEAVSTYLRR